MKTFLSAALAFATLLLPGAVLAQRASRADREPAPPRPMTEIDPSEANADYVGKKDVLVLDVRTAGEFDQGHLPGAVNLPLQELAFRRDELDRHRDKTILVYCRTQNRSAVARGFLARDHRVVLMKGGFTAWQQQDLPIER